MQKTIILPVVAALILAGCTLPSGATLGISPHGYCGEILINGERFTACPTIDGKGKPMGYRKNKDGSIENMYSTIKSGDTSATGPSADIVAETKQLELVLLVCAVAPKSEFCNKRAPTN
jgi:hypothetical protein